MRKSLTIILMFGLSMIAIWLGSVYPLIGSSIFAIGCGVIIRHTNLYNALDKEILNFVSKHLLKAGIVLLGFNLSLRTVSIVDLNIIVLLLLLIVVSLSVSYVFSKVLGVPKILGLLIGVGTSICGGSAIVATSPILEAEDEVMLVSITTMLLYSIVAIFVLPIVGQVLGYSDQMYGILAGSAVNDTSSVLATSFAFSESAWQIATIVKLVRTLFIVPVSVGLIVYKLIMNKHTQENPIVKTSQILKTIPVFIIFFLIAVLITSTIQIPDDILNLTSKVSKILMTIAFIRLGLGVHVKQIITAGYKPLVLGGITWSSVLITSILLIQSLY